MACQTVPIAPRDVPLPNTQAVALVIRGGQAPWNFMPPNSKELATWLIVFRITVFDYFILTI